MAKVKKISNKKKALDNNQLDNTLQRNIRIIGIVIFIFCLFYLLTLWITRDTTKNNIEDDSNYSTFSFTEIMAGRSFSMSDGEYYVLFYDSTDEEMESIYSSLVSSYRVKEGALTIYTVNMGDGLNKSVLSESSNPSPTSANELAISGPTLIQFNNHEVVQYIEGEESIKSYLG